jgi:TolB protein
LTQPAPSTNRGVILATDIRNFADVRSRRSGMTSTRFVAAALAALALVAPTALSVVPAASASGDAGLLGPNQVTTGDRVPWGKVGTGWYLTLVDQGPMKEFGIDAHHQLLDLVDPLGGRYQLDKTVVRKDGTGYRHLVDWSTDGHTALELVDSAHGRSHAALLNLPAGTAHSIVLDETTAGLLLAPSGGMYEIKDGGAHGQALVRRDDTGTTEVIREHTDGDPLTTPDDRRIVVGAFAQADHHLFVLGSRGSVLRTLTTPRKCQASRWWSPGVVMASCFWHRGTTRLYAVPIDGSPGHWISADHGRHSADLGDLDARVLHGTTYLEAAGPCGVVFLARQHRDGAATKVNVPKATQNVYLIGTRGDDLVLHMGISCDGNASRDAITHFDPSTGRNRIVAELPLDEAYGTILGFAERRVPMA